MEKTPDLYFLPFFNISSHKRTAEIAPFLGKSDCHQPSSSLRQVESLPSTTRRQIGQDHLSTAILLVERRISFKNIYI